MELKKLMPGEIRFLVKKIGASFRVYDKARGGFPYTRPELGGAVKQDVPQKEAQEEADRLNQEYGTAAAKPSKKQRSVVEEVEPVEEAELAELPDYGEVLSEEEASKYTEGIFEEPKY